MITLLTNHAVTRMEERHLSPDLILEIIHTGKKRFRATQKVYEYVKIIGGVKYLVLANLANVVITAYRIQNKMPSKRVKDTRQARLKKKKKLQGEKLK